MNTINYTCPYCGKEFEINVYPAVSAEDKELRDRIVSGDIFRNSCPHCKKDFMVQYPLVYTDKENKFVLWLSEQEVGDTLKDFTKPLLEKGFKLRRCSTINELVEKIAIFEDGADDVMVELAKYDSFIEFIDNKKGKAEDVTSIDYQKYENGILKINVRTDDKGMAFIIPVSMLEEEIEQNKELYEIDNSMIPLINDAWIISLFQESDGEA